MSNIKRVHFLEYYDVFKIVYLSLNNNDYPMSYLISTIFAKYVTEIKFTSIYL